MPVAKQTKDCLLTDIGRRCEKSLRPNKERSLLRLTRPTVFWSADRTLFPTSHPILFAAAPCMASCVVDRDRERPQGSQQVKIKQRKGDLDCWPRLLCRDPGAHRDVRRHSIDTTRFLSAAANCASFSLLATCCFNSETWHVGLFFYFFGRFVLAQLISCLNSFSSTVMPVAVNFPADKKPFCRGRLLHVDEDATLLSVWRVPLGDNESLLTLRI